MLALLIRNRLSKDNWTVESKRIPFALQDLGLQSRRHHKCYFTALSYQGESDNDCGIDIIIFNYDNQNLQIMKLVFFLSFLRINKDNKVVL